MGNNLPRFYGDRSYVSVTICEFVVSIPGGYPLADYRFWYPFRYATSLRQLRPFARIIRFKKAQPAIMVKRLRDICERESLSADARSLTTLVEITNADVRSCLNTLQVRQVLTKPFMHRLNSYIFAE